MNYDSILVIFKDGLYNRTSAYSELLLYTQTRIFKILYQSYLRCFEADSFIEKFVRANLYAEVRFKL